MPYTREDIFTLSGKLSEVYRKQSELGEKGQLMTFEKDTPWGPGPKDLERNFHIFSEVLSLWPNKTPGQHFLAACWMEANSRTPGGIFDSSCETDIEIASLKFAFSLKTLLIFLRALTRRTKKSRSTRIRSLKSLCIISNFKWTTARLKQYRKKDARL